MDTGYAIRFCRQQRKLSIPELASRAGLSKSYVSLLERNERDPPMSTLKKLASALNVPFSVFIFLAMPVAELEGISAIAAEKLTAATMKLLRATKT
jgi:transcriptional regulator with XRE-family HTH domain